MARIDHTVHIRLLTYDPAQDVMVPVPDVTFLCEHDGWLHNPNLYEGDDNSDNNGQVTIAVSIEEGEENQLNPFFTLTAEQTVHRNFPAASAASLQFNLPEEWVTWHYQKERLKNLVSFSDPAAPLELFIGLDCHLEISYADFDSSQKRNPLALPSDTLSVELIDQDAFLGIDAFAPDDHLQGVAFDSVEQRIVSVGDERKRLPYADVWPVVPCALDSLAQPAASVQYDPPDMPLGVLGGASFNTTGAIAVDKHGFVFMIDGDEVKRFYPDGRCCETIDGFNAPGALALDRFRHLFVADTGNNRIVCLEPDWADGRDGVYKISTALSGAIISTAISNPSGLAVITDPRIDGEDWLAVANTGSQQIKLYRIDYRSLGNRSTGFYSRLIPRLSHIANFGAAGNGAGQFQQPQGVAVDRQGRLLVCDQQLHRLSRWRKNVAGTNYELDQEWQRSGGGAGNGTMEFDTPVAVAVDPLHDYAYVVELGNQRIQRFDIDSGNHQLFWQPTHNPALSNSFQARFVATGRYGEVYVSDSANQRLLHASVFADDGSLQSDNDTPRALAVWTPAGVEPDSDDKTTWHLSAPQYLKFSGDSLWVSDSGNGRLIRFDPVDGELKPAQTVNVPAPSGNAEPQGLALSSDNQLFVADRNTDQLLQFDASFTLQNRFGSHGSGDDEYDEPRGVDIYQPTTGDTLIYVADKNNDRIKVLQSNGSFVRHINGSGSTTLDRPEDVAVRARDGQLFVADTGNSRIVEFDSSGTLIDVIIIRNSSESFSLPCALSLDPVGHLLVSDRDRHAVYRIEADGTRSAPKGHLHAYWNLKHLVRQQVSPAGSAKVFYPQLEKQLLLQAPHGAVMNRRGLLCIAERDHHRIRLLRAFTPISLNSFAPGTGVFDRLPDIYVKTQAKADWSERYGLKLEISDIGWVFDDLNELSTPPADDFSDDHFRNELPLAQREGMAAAVNVMRVVKQVQRWYRHLTRQDELIHRWGHSSEDVPTLQVDISDEQGSNRPWRKAHVNIISDAAAVPIQGAWDNRVVAHEMTHWVQEASSQPQPPFKQQAAEHHNGEAINQIIAMLEGYAEYVHLFWGAKYGSSDRLRGYRLTSGSGSLHSLNICTANCDKFDRAERTQKATDDYLFGGDFSAARPDYSEPGLGLRSEGYFANCLYQIHHALVSPDVLYAAAPNYWYRFNAWIDDARSGLFSRIFRQALRTFPEDPSDDEWVSPTRLYQTQMLAAAYAESDELGEMLQTINELNNQLMPTINLSRDGSSSAPGSTIGSEIEINEGDSFDLTIQVADIGGRSLRGYQIHIHIEPPASALSYTLPGGAGPQRRHGRSGTAGGNDFYRASNASGIINLTVQAAAGSAGNTDTISISYQPDFDDDAALAAPVKGDDQFSVMRQWYLHELRAVNKVWSGAGENYGAIVTNSVRVSVLP